MGATFHKHGDRVDYTPGGNVTAGDVVVLTDIVGVATSDIPAGTLGSLAVEGIFVFSKAAGVEIAFGQIVQYDADTDTVTTNGTYGDVTIGVAAATAAAGDPTVLVKLCPGLEAAG